MVDQLRSTNCVLQPARQVSDKHPFYAAPKAIVHNVHTKLAQTKAKLAMQTVKLSGGAIKLKESPQDADMGPIQMQSMNTAASNSISLTPEASPLVMSGCYAVSCLMLCLLPYLLTYVKLLAAIFTGLISFCTVRCLVLCLLDWSDLLSHFPVSFQLRGKLDQPVEALPTKIHVSFDTCFQSAAGLSCATIQDDAELTGVSESKN